MTDLTRIDLATEEDKQYHIDSWAKLFKADTWEDLRMIASEDEALYEAAKTLFYQSSDEEIRMRCLDREEYYQDLKNYERKIGQDRLEHEHDLRNYERKIEQDRLEHEQDLRNYEHKIEQNRLEHELNLRNYEHKIEQNRLEHARICQNYKKIPAENNQALAGKSQTISAQAVETERLRTELARLTN